MLASSAHQKIYSLCINNEHLEMRNVSLRLTVAFYTAVVGHLGKEQSLEKCCLKRTMFKTSSLGRN